MKSNIYLMEAVPNSRRRTSGAPEYFPAIVHYGYLQVDGEPAKVPALFTAKAIDEAIQRAIKQPEDAPAVTAKKGWVKTFLEAIGLGD